MLKHEHFEELAAVRVRGELTPAQEQELRRHLADCGDCRQVYEQYEELCAPLRPELDPEMELLIESRRENVKAAVLQSVSHLQAQPRTNVPPARPFPVTVVPWNSQSAISAGIAAAIVMAAGFWLGLRYERSVLSASTQPPQPSAVLQTTEKPDTPSDPPKQLADVRYTQLTNDLLAEKNRAARLDSALTDRDRKFAESENARLLLQQQVDSESEDLQSTRALLAGKTDEVKQMEAAKASDSHTLLALQDQVQDLTERLNNQAQSLDRERQLLANGRDIRDIIGARNLHIIDVYDTDPEGNTRKSFARAFYTEGKSLVFYAYDLPARGTDDGKFVYTAWGERNGNKSKVQRLGILLNDDKGQKRWALNFSDPKVLSEIDSVFVTLERVGVDGTEPKGKRMLTAYLDSQVNHP